MNNFLFLDVVHFHRCQDLLGGRDATTKTDDEQIVHETQPTKDDTNAEGGDEQIDDTNVEGGDEHIDGDDGDPLTKEGKGKNPKKRGRLSKKEYVAPLKKSARESRKPPNYANEQEKTNAQVFAIANSSKGLTEFWFASTPQQEQHLPQFTLHQHQHSHPY